MLPDDSVLNPTHTQYSSRALYRDFDVTALLREGENVLTAEVGNGFFNENSGVWKWQEAQWRSAPRLLCDLFIEYADGTRETVATDESWELTLDGPTTANGIYQGETFDVTLTAADVTLYRVCNEMSCGDFWCSNERLNRMHRLMHRTMRNNFQGKPTDTPVWEKNGWLRDANMALSTMLYNFDMGNFLTRTAFTKAFYRPDRQLYETDFWRAVGGRTKYRQTSNLIPLAFGLAPKEDVAAVAGNLAADIRGRGNHLDTGCAGTRFLLPVLTDLGYGDLAWQLLMQDTYPGWGFWLAQGADTIWESWELTTRSMDHYCLGTFDEYLFSHVVGIRKVREGYRSLVIEPVFPTALEAARARLETVRGELACGWERRESGALTLSLRIPFGTSAQVRLPGGAAFAVASGRYEISGSAGSWTVTEKDGAKGACV